MAVNNWYLKYDATGDGRLNLEQFKLLLRKEFNRSDTDLEIEQIV